MCTYIGWKGLTWASTTPEWVRYQLIPNLYFSVSTPGLLSHCSWWDTTITISTLCHHTTVIRKHIKTFSEVLGTEYTFCCDRGIVRHKPRWHNQYKSVTELCFVQTMWLGPVSGHSEAGRGLPVPRGAHCCTWEDGGASIYALLSFSDVWIREQVIQDTRFMDNVHWGKPKKLGFWFHKFTVKRLSPRRRVLRRRTIVWCSAVATPSPRPLPAGSSSSLQSSQLKRSMIAMKTNV